MDEEYWRKYREGAQRRAGAKGLLIIAPIGIVVAVLSVFAPMDHPAGDIRDDIVFRLVAAGLFIAFEVALVVGSVRLLRRGTETNRG